MSRVWLGLKYGTPRAGITLYRVDDISLVRAFLKKAVREARWKAEESRVVDPILGLVDRFDLEKLKGIIDLILLPPTGNAVEGQAKLSRRQRLFGFADRKRINNG